MSLLFRPCVASIINKCWHPCSLDTPILANDSKKLFIRWIDRIRALINLQRDAAGAYSTCFISRPRIAKKLEQKSLWLSL